MLSCEWKKMSKDTLDRKEKVSSHRNAAGNSSKELWPPLIIDPSH